jgi:hypothetical protein
MQLPAQAATVAFQADRLHHVVSRKTPLIRSLREAAARIARARASDPLRSGETIGGADMQTDIVAWRERWFWVLLAFVATISVVFMPREMYPGDPVTVREETRAILLHGELAVEPFVAKHYAETQEKGQYVVEHLRNGRSYSKYGSMLAFAYILPMAAEWLLEGELPPFSSPRRTLYLNAFNILMSLLIAASLYRTARRFEAADWVAASFVSLCFFTTFLWNFLRVQNTEIFQLLCFAWSVTTFLDVLDARQHGRNDHWPVLRLWAASNAMLLTRLSYVFVGPCFALGLLCDRMRRSDGSLSQAMLRESRCHVLPALAGIACLAAFNTVKFGAPWLSGYHAWARGQSLDRLFHGNLIEAVYNLTFSTQWGLLYLFPMLWLAIPLAPPWLRRHAVSYGTIVLIAAVSTFLVASRVNWRGEMSYGPRYWIFIAPFLALPATQAIAWLTTPTLTARLAAAATAMVLWHSTSEQLAINRHLFFAYYYITGPLENAMTMEAARFFSTNSFGYVTREMESKFPDELDWWTNMQPKLRPVAAGAYEKHVREVLGQSNLFWFP